MKQSAALATNFSAALGRKSRIAVSRHEWASGLLIASIGLAGVITAILGLLFFLNMEPNQRLKSPLFFFEDLSRVEKPVGIAEDFGEMGVAELTEIEEPQMADTLEMVTEAISTHRSAIVSMDSSSAESGRVTGLGDKREIGLAFDDGKEKRTAGEHWLVRYSTKTKAEYAKQLDFFKIEIGSLSKTGSLIEYASSLSAEKPKYRKGARKDEKRVYFKKPNNHPVSRWDEALLELAGAESENRLILTFYPEKTVRELSKLEEQQLLRDRKQIEDVRITMFSVEAKTGGGYLYKIQSIKYH